MILGLIHEKGIHRSNSYVEIFEHMASNIGEKCDFIVRDYGLVEEWRRAILNCIKVKISGIVILDEFVPAPRIRRESISKDTGIADMLYGNLTNQWVDKDNDGFYEEEELPEGYTQDAWVCRWIPHNMMYSNWWWMKLFGYKDYDYQIKRWKEKLEGYCGYPMMKVGILNDSSGTTGQGYSLKEELVFPYFKGHFNTIKARTINPRDNAETQRHWYPVFGNTLYIQAHSDSYTIGDYTHKIAYECSKYGVGPTALVVFGCDVGEWNKAGLYQRPNLSVVGNILNSKEKNNTRVILCSGTTQAGMGQDEDFQGEGKSFFAYMAESACFGEAVKNWIQFGVDHYMRKSKEIPKWRALCVTAVGMSIYGDATVRLK